MSEVMLDDVNQGLVRPELLQVADAVARDKTIDREIVIQAMEQAIQTASRRKYGQELEIRAEIDRKTGEIRLNRVRHIVEEVEDDATQLSLEAALAMDPNLEVGGELTEPLPPIDLGRVAAAADSRADIHEAQCRHHGDPVDLAVRRVLGDCLHGTAPLHLSQTVGKESRAPARKSRPRAAQSRSVVRQEVFLQLHADDHRCHRWDLSRCVRPPRNHPVGRKRSCCW